MKENAYRWDNTKVVLIRRGVTPTSVVIIIYANSIGGSCRERWVGVGEASRAINASSGNSSRTVFVVGPFQTSHHRTTNLRSIIIHDIALKDGGDVLGANILMNAGNDGVVRLRVTMSNVGNDYECGH